MRVRVIPTSSAPRCVLLYRFVLLYAKPNPIAHLVGLALHVDRRGVDPLEHVLGKQREGAHLARVRVRVGVRVRVRVRFRFRVRVRVRVRVS